MSIFIYIFGYGIYLQGRYYIITPGLNSSIIIITKQRNIDY